MAINFLNNLNFNSIQVENIVIENFASDVLAGTGVEGQIYWNTTAHQLRGWDGNAGAWIPIGTQDDTLTFAGDAGGNQTVDLNAQIFTVGGTANEIKTSGTGQTLSVSLADGAYNATPGAGTNLELPDGSAAVTQTAGDNTRKVATTAFVTTAVAASDTLAEVLAIGNTTGGTDIAVSTGDDIVWNNNSKAIFGAVGDGLDIYHTGSNSYIEQTSTFETLYISSNSVNLRSNNSETFMYGSTNAEVALFYDGGKKFETASNGIKIYGGIKDVNNSLGTAGQVLSSTGTTLDWVDDNNTTYTLPVTAGTVSPGTPTSGIITLTDSDGVTDPVNFTGTTGRIDVSGDAGSSSIIIDLTDDVTILGELTVQGTGVSSFAGDLDMNNNKLTEVKTGTVATDGVNLGQVEALVAGIGLFKGGYNATTGLTVNLGAGNGSLDGASNIALDQGDFFVVTVAGGAFYTQTLEIGDMIFANTTIAANSTPPITDYTVVIADANIATANTTAANTNKGVAGFDSAYFDVTTGADAGWVQLNSQRNPYGATQTLDNTSPVSRAEANGLTTFTIDLADTTLFGAGALAKNVAAEVTQNVAPYQTVYADVTRSGTASMSIVFSGSVAVDIYRVLLSHI